MGAHKAGKHYSKSRAIHRRAKDKYNNENRSREWGELKIGRGKGRYVTLRKTYRGSVYYLTPNKKRRYVTKDSRVRKMRKSKRAAKREKHEAAEDVKPSPTY